MASQISGNVGSANSGTIISAFKMDGRVSNGIFGAVAPGAATLITQAIAAANGSWTIGGLAAGTYLLTGTKGPAVIGQPGVPVEPSIQFGTFIVDGSTSYNI